MPEVSRTLKAIASADAPREERARTIAETIRQHGDYRWVGIYHVGADEIAVIGWSGPDAPTFPRFPATQGLNGAAVLAGKTVIVGDVTKDPRYLTTLGTTRAEMVVPVKVGERTIGTIDVESETLNRFTESDREFVQRCARAIVALYPNL